MDINNYIYYYYKFQLFIKPLEYNDLKILRFAYLLLSVLICLNNLKLRAMTQFEFNNNLIGMKTNLQRFAMSLTSDRDNALDLVQDTYLKAITYKDKFVDYTNLKACSYL